MENRLPVLSMVDGSFLRFPQKNYRNLHRSYVHMEIFSQNRRSAADESGADASARICDMTCVICDIGFKKFFSHTRVYVRYQKADLFRLPLVAPTPVGSKTDPEKFFGKF